MLTDNSVSEIIYIPVGPLPETARGILCNCLVGVLDIIHGRSLTNIDPRILAGRRKGGGYFPTHVLAYIHIRNMVRTRYPGILYKLSYRTWSTGVHSKSREKERRLSSTINGQRRAGVDCRPKLSPFTPTRHPHPSFALRTRHHYHRKYNTRDDTSPI